jgi:hypothetical protein
MRIASTNFRGVLTAFTRCILFIGHNYFGLSFAAGADCADGLQLAPFCIDRMHFK